MVLLEQSWRLLYLDAIVHHPEHPWLGTAVTTRRHLAQLYDDQANQLWAKRWYKSGTAVVGRGGWHFSFMGGEDLICSKMQGTGHTDISIDSLEAHDFGGILFRPTAHADLPDTVKRERARWGHLLYDDDQYRQFCLNLRRHPHYADVRQGD